MRQKIIYAADCIIILICLTGFYHVYEKAGLPVNFVSGGLSVESIKNGSLNENFRKNDRVLSLNKHKVNTQEEVEFLLDGCTIGDKVNVNVEREGKHILIEEYLTPFYSSRYLVVQMIVSIVFILLALFVISKQKKNPAAELFNWVMLFSTLIIATTWGRYTIEPNGSGHFIRFVFNSAYAFTGVVFVHFTFLFPYRKGRFLNNLLYLLYFSALIISIILNYRFLKASVSLNLDWFRIYNSWFNLCRLFFVSSVFIGLINVIHTYITAKDESERRKLRWILLGIYFGPLCLITLWILPQIFTSKGLVAEEFVLIAMLSVPIAFTISIVRYQILNIDQIFKRGTIYTLTLLFIMFTYVVIVSSVSLFLGSLTISASLISSTIAAVIIAAAFGPVKEKIHFFVDKKFFNVKYNYKLAEKEFIDKIKYCYDEKILFENLIESIQNLIPAKYTRILINTEEQICSGLFEAINNSQIPIGRSEYLELGALFNNGELVFMENYNAVLIFGIYTEKKGVIAVLLLGEKKSGFRYNLEDMDLLETFCSQTAIAYERIELQRDLISEQIEKKKFKELNELKSYFVSSVTHDLKTPLTSIKMFSEMIHDSPGLTKEKRDEYLEIIKGESEHLSRLIDNVLDITKIEKGIKQYHFSETDLNDCVKDVFKAMQYQLNLNMFQCSLDLFSKNLLIMADKDALKDLIINLISNSIKYSGSFKEISVKTFEANGNAVIKISDKGFGIAEDNLERIFKPFERINNNDSNKAKGTGIGLAIVKNIADAHKGVIDVESRLGKGTSFAITFKLSKEI